MYSIIEREVTGYDASAGCVCRVTIVADSTADIPDPDPSWAVGSICCVAEDHSYKILNNEREWA